MYNGPHIAAQAAAISKAAKLTARVVKASHLTACETARADQVRRIGKLLRDAKQEAAR